MSTLSAPSQLPLFGLKICAECGDPKPESEFYFQDKAAGRLFRNCKSCHYAQTLRNKKIAADPVLKARRDAEKAEEKRLREVNAPPELACKKCGKTKPKAAFRKNRKACRSCEIANRDPEETARTLKRYEERHRKERNATARAHYASDRELGKAKLLAWRKEHRESGLRANREYRKRNPGLNRILCAARVARIRGNGGRYTLDDWERIKAQSNWSCLACGGREPDVILHADHIIPISMGGFNIASNLQVLCAQCNLTKRAKFIDYRPDPYGLKKGT